MMQSKNDLEGKQSAYKQIRGIGEAHSSEWEYRPSAYRELISRTAVSLLISIIELYYKKKHILSSL